MAMSGPGFPLAWFACSTSSHPFQLGRHVDYLKPGRSLPIAAALGVQQQVAPCCDVLIEFDPALAPHPHELTTPISDQALERGPVRPLKFLTHAPSYADCL